MSNFDAALVIPVSAQDIVDIQDWCNEHAYDRDKILRKIILDVIHS